MLDATVEPESLSHRAVGGGLAVAVAQVGRTGLQFIALAVMARILTPTDYGLMGMVTSLTAILLIFQEYGLSTATVQRDQLTNEQVSVLFWLNTLLGGAATLICIIAAPLAAWFYAQPHLKSITIAFAFSFLLGSLGIQHRALLRRSLRFWAAAAVDLAAAFIGITSGIVLALCGLRYWSLVIMNLVITASGTAGVWWACRWIPARPRLAAGARGLVKFGTHVTGFNLINYLARNLDKILIGRYWGAAALGYYSRAYQLLIFPLNQLMAPLANVAIPILSRLQRRPAQFARYYLTALRLLALITMPAWAFCAAMPGEVIRVVLGPQWGPAIPMFRFLALAAVVHPACTTVGWALLAWGRSDRYLLWALFVSPLAILSFVIGLPFGAAGVARAYAAFSYAILLPAFCYLARYCPIATLRLIKAIAAPVLLAALSFVAATGSAWLLPANWAALSRLGAAAVLVVVLDGAVLVGFSPLRQGVRENLVILRNALKASPGGADAGTPHRQAEQAEGGIK